MLAIQLALCVALASNVASASSMLYFHETFDDRWEERWVHSSSALYGGRAVVAAAPHWENNGLQLPAANQHYGIAAAVSEPIMLNQGLVLQYEVKHADTHTCGGSYLKLLSSKQSWQPADLHRDSPYSIMFGPDKCGQGKVHLILRHPNGRNGSLEERHLVDPPQPPSDKLTHVYTLRLTPICRYEVLVDGVSRSSGSLLDSQRFQPPFQPPAQTPDPKASKPADWVDAAMIPDPAARQPADWDDRLQIPDPADVKPAGWLDAEPPLLPNPKAVRPADWDDEEDGEWLADTIPNPKCKVGCGPWKPRMQPNPAYKGPWKAPQISNPKYKGPWQAPLVPNPDYWQEQQPLHKVEPVGAVAVEVWTIDPNYYFDNIILARDDQMPKQLREQEWRPRHEKEKAAQAAEDADAVKKQAEEQRQAAEAGKKKKGKGKGKDSTPGLAGWIRRQFKRPALKPLKPYAQPLLRLLKKQPALAYPLCLLPPLLGILLLALWPKGEKQYPDPTAWAKKHDISGPDDGPEEEEENEEENENEREREEGADPSPQVDGTDSAGLAVPSDDVRVGRTGVSGSDKMQITKPSVGGSSDEFEMVSQSIGEAVQGLPGGGARAGGARQ
ncbi:Calreticulin family-domain-containing protein [Haematococcus lacustris]